MYEALTVHTLVCTVKEDSKQMSRNIKTTAKRQEEQAFGKSWAIANEQSQVTTQLQEKHTTSLQTIANNILTGHARHHVV